jgi:hypothetical protein
MRRRLQGTIAIAALALGCEETAPAEAAAPGCHGEVLFGRPNAATGLTSEQCQPRCSCDGKSWEAPEYGEQEIQEILTWEIVDPPALLTEDPYAAAAPPSADPEAVCGVLPEAPGARRYRLATYGSQAAAEEAGAFPSHFGACGLCSPLVDLAVYMREPDLTEPVRACGLQHLGGDPEEHLACLEALGFDRACAQIWYYNTLHTRDACSAPCFATLGDPYHLPDGSLNACLACDEEKSGPVFKAVAGRTRRNTGLANALCRPCSEVRPLVHDYR